MLWFRKNTDRAQEKDDSVLPGELKVAFDSGIFESKLQQLLATTGERGGVDEFVDALVKKHELFEQALNGESELDAKTLETLLDTVFTARRKLPAGMNDMPHDHIVMHIRELLKPDHSLMERMNKFADAFATDDRKVRGAALDFAAELLHFTWPERYPLMCRWVWDVNTVSGALREFIRANDGLPEIPIGAEPEQYEAARVWLREKLSEQGFYREVPFLIDLVMAQAYTDYVLAMSSGMGMMGSEFGGKMEPIDFIAKLLGIDTARRSGKTRVKKITLH